MPLTSRVEKSEPKLYKLDSVFGFGKYKGCTVDDVLEDHPGYIEWCIENIDGFEIHTEVDEDPRWVDYQFRDLIDDVLDGEDENPYWYTKGY